MLLYLHHPFHIMHPGKACGVNSQRIFCKISLKSHYILSRYYYQWYLIFSGMWTQSKNKFNNDYQLQMLHPIPIHCDAATAQGFSDCAFLSEAGAERNLDLMQQCSAGNEGRCFGWELVKITNRNSIHGPKFQWRHSCREDGSGCTHLMMHADVSIALWVALYIQISTSSFCLFFNARFLFLCEPKYLYYE